jgi:hypothetical protein
MASVSIHGHGVEITREIEERIQVLVPAALRSLEARVKAVCVRLHRGADPDASASCHISVDFDRGGGIAVGATAVEISSALVDAARRLAAVPAKLRDAHGTPSHSYLH